MADLFLSLTLEERREVLESALDRGLARSAALLEKDVWVVWTLQALFAAPFADDLVFKGGTSLSKAYNIIQRFSEDVDLTYDIRKLADEQAGLQATGRRVACDLALAFPVRRRGSCAPNEHSGKRPPWPTSIVLKANCEARRGSPTTGPISFAWTNPDSQPPRWAIGADLPVPAPLYPASGGPSRGREFKGLYEFLSDSLPKGWG